MELKSNKYHQNTIHEDMCIDKFFSAHFAYLLLSDVFLPNILVHSFPREPNGPKLISLLFSHHYVLETGTPLQFQREND